MLSETALKNLQRTRLEWFAVQLMTPKLEDLCAVCGEAYGKHFAVGPLKGRCPIGEDGLEGLVFQPAKKP